MARVIAPFKIVGTLDDLTFYLDQENNNLVKTKGKPGITTKEFLKNPIFTKHETTERNSADVPRKVKILEQWLYILIIEQKTEVMPDEALSLCSTSKTKI